MQQLPSLLSRRSLKKLPFDPQDFLIVLEDEVVMSTKSWVSALMLIFGLLYALHISYPKKLTIFFFSSYRKCC